MVQGKSEIVQKFESVPELKFSRMREFGQSSTARGSLIKVMESGMGRTFYSDDESGRMIATAATTAENSRSAMVVGVCTLEAYRGQGIASKCMTALCKQLLSELAVVLRGIRINGFY